MLGVEPQSLRRGGQRMRVPAGSKACRKSPRCFAPGIDRVWGPEDNPRPWATPVWPRSGVIAMRRLGVIVALGALLGLFGGVVTASPALARGPKWQFQPKSPVTLPAAYCGFEIRVTFPVIREFEKILKASDGTRIGLFTGSVIDSFTNLENGKTITENVSGPSKTIGFPDGSFTTMENGRNEALIGQPTRRASGCPPWACSTAGGRPRWLRTEALPRCPSMVTLWLTCARR